MVAWPHERWRSTHGRAARATPFHLLNRVIKACQEHGFRNFSLKAMNKRAEAES